jgi:hypothetical protein
LGVAVTFVDWEDMTRWQNINKELELGIPEPVETYSSSEHLFADLGIPAGTKGRLNKKPAAEPKPKASQPTAKKDEPAKPKARQRQRNYKKASKPQA